MKDTLFQFYTNVSGKILQMINDAKVIKAESQRKELEKIILNELPQKAIKRHYAQFLFLASRFRDFGLFVESIEFESLHREVNDTSKSIQLITKYMDIGFANLSATINSFKTDYNAIQSQDIVDDLKTVYHSAIEKPIIDDRELYSKQEEIKLSFPKVIEAFIPQSYKCLSYNKKTRLEDELTWQDLVAKNDLSLFFIRYLDSPDSIDFPLIILGHPGSGKSLLTKVLSAQLMSNSYTFIRIPLREVNADSTIDSLVEDQIRKVTNRTLPAGGYAVFAKQFKEKPLTIILDGYDELLQAKGDVFANYLDITMRFQQNQKEMKRPVRIIVTSRITLIDKATVPVGATVLRLLEFNDKQRDAWIDIWNKANNNYFNSCDPKLRPFSLPKTKEKSVVKEKSSIIELAEQPLLLLMLALYDSEGNSLAALNNDLNRTKLYNDLIRCFIHRERSRYVAGFNEDSSQEQKVIIEHEMKRLGVVAIGMFNRKKLVIHINDLENDLKHFESGRSNQDLIGKKLKDSESLLGGFFFIHQSKAKDISENSDKVEIAFEFLHNTFGEFLIADMVLRFAIQEAKALDACKKNPSLANELTRKLKSPDGLCKEWFACLMFTPLFSRPIVLEMIQEHVSQAMANNDISEKDFFSNFGILIKSQLKMILSARSFPQAMTQENKIVEEIPLLGLISIYTLNLLILASVLFRDGFVFDEEDYCNHDVSPSETKPWDKLAFLWKAWFSLENLTGLSTIFNAKREGKRILIKCREKFEAISLNQPVDILLCVSFALSDMLNVGLAGLHSSRFSKIISLEKIGIAKMLQQDNINLCFEFYILCLRNTLFYISNDYNYISKSSDINLYNEINELVANIIENMNPLNVHTVTSESLLSFIEVVEIGIVRKVFYIKTRKSLIKFISFLYVSLSEDLEVLGVPNMLLSNYGVLLSGLREVLYKLTIYENDQLTSVIYNLKQYRLNSKLKTITEIGESVKYKHYIQEMDTHVSISHNLIMWLEETKSIDIGKKIGEFDEELSIDFIRELSRIDPKLMSRMLLKQSRFDEETIKFCIGKVFTEIEESGFNFVESETILNIIELALRTQNSNLKYFVRDGVRKTFADLGLNNIGLFLFYNPELLISLFDICPDFFKSNDSLCNLADISIASTNENFTYGKFIFNYIKLVRKMMDMKDEQYVRFTKIIIRLILKQTTVELSKLDLSTIKIDDLDCLYWFSKFSKNKKLNVKIKKVLCKFDDYDDLDSFILNDI